MDLRAELVEDRLMGSTIYIHGSSTMHRALYPLIEAHTRPSRAHLTPELALRLVTRACALWRAGAHDAPFPDPFWAFYWPGGQAAARYILDNRRFFEDRSLLDVGCGCGAGSIAAVKVGAKRVVANDIDLYALAATEMNADMNGVSVETDSRDFIGAKCEGFDTILIGDMFYDEEFANKLFDWLHVLSKGRKTVLIGDPGRHGLTEKRRRDMTLLAKYKLPEDSCLENNGFSETTLWRLNP